jgi:ribose transport system substrate-binding protein
MTTESPSTTQTTYPAGRRTGLWILLVILALLAIVAALWAMGMFKPRPRVALVTASSGPYWDLIVKGAQEAADRHNVRLDVLRPPSDEASQTSAMQGLLDKGYTGIAVSPADPVRQARVVGQLAAQTNLVTYDADLPVSRRLCFVGTDNYDAGRMCGQMVREALPQGGKVIVAVGSVDKENGQRRRQGLIDELLERSFEPNRPMDAVDGPPMKGPKYTVVATLVDNLNADNAVKLASDALKKNADVGCIVGLFASNTPAVLKALEQNGRLGKVKVVGFDANDATIDGIRHGNVYGTIVQDAYNIGFQAVRILADANEGDPNAVPLYPTFHLRCDEIRQDNVEEMVKAMASRTKPVARVTTQPTTEESASTPESTGSSGSSGAKR